MFNINRLTGWQVMIAVLAAFLLGAVAHALLF